MELDVFGNAELEKLERSSTKHTLNKALVTLVAKLLNIPTKKELK